MVDERGRPRLQGNYVPRPGTEEHVPTCKYSLWTAFNCVPIKCHTENAIGDVRSGLHVHDYRKAYEEQFRMSILGWCTVVVLCQQTAEYTLAYSHPGTHENTAAPCFRFALAAESRVYV